MLIRTVDAHFRGAMLLGETAEHLTGIGHLQAANRIDLIAPGPGNALEVITLKRGIVDSSSLFDWIKETRTNGPGGKKKSVTITLHDEAQAPVRRRDGDICG